MKPDYPEVLERGVRRLRRWRVALNSPGPAAEDLEQFGVPGDNYTSPVATITLPHPE